MTGQFDGQVVLITGAASGIGQATARMFAREGAFVKVLDVQDVSGEATVEGIVREGGTAAYHHADVTDEAAVEAVVTQIADDHGRIDVLFNNAGGSTVNDGDVYELDLKEFWRCVSLDLAGTVIVSKKVLPHMIAAKRGSIVHATSIGAMIGIAHVSGYTAAKGGVSALTRSMAVEYASYGIRVNAVAPGVTLSDRVRKLTSIRGDEQERASRALLGFNEPDDIAHAVLFLASEAARRITGVILPIDGGSTAC